jgi:hypothetical protein
MKVSLQYVTAVFVLVCGLMVWAVLAVLSVVSWVCGESVGFLLRAVFGIIEDEYEGF